MYVIYCKLVNIWVKGIAEDRKHITYTANRHNAKRFSDKYQAEKFIKRLPPIWQSKCEVMLYAESTHFHDRYFATPAMKEVIDYLDDNI